jgi:4-amino-4-deoxy-L-arabinose transferase-like glycosyltransferase
MRDLAITAALAVVVLGATCLSSGTHPLRASRHPLVQIGGDTPGYLSGADYVLAGHLPPGKLKSRILYIEAIALSRRLGSGLLGVVAVQVLLAILAAAALYDLTRRLGGTWAALIAATFFAANPDIARWHTYILTDSFYISAVILTAWAVHRATERGGLWFVIAGLTVVASAMLRPHGWVLVVVSGAYWLPTRSAETSRWQSASAAAAMLALLAAVPWLLDSDTHAEAAKLMPSRGEVIWGYPPARLAMPGSPLPDQPSISAGVGYLLRHPIACARLVAARAFTELAHTRPFYSRAHNMALALFLPPFYMLAALGIFGLRRQPLTWLLAAIIAGHVAVVGLTFADWDGRFLLYLLPMVGLLSACGLMHAIDSTWARATVGVRTHASGAVR